MSVIADILPGLARHRMLQTRRYRNVVFSPVLNVRSSPFACAYIEESGTSVATVLFEGAR